MANPYPADVADSGGNVRLSGAITFTDPDNQPGGGVAVWQGPFSLAWNSVPNPLTDPVPLVILDPGTLVLDFRAVLTALWDAAGGLNLYSDADLTTAAFRTARLDSDAVLITPPPFLSNTLEATGAQGWIVAAANQGVWATIAGGDSPVSGAVDVYVQTMPAA